MSSNSGGMADPHGGNRLYSDVAQNQGLDSTTPAAVGGGVKSPNVRLRSFAEIVASEKSNRNILEIKLKKIATDDENVVKVKPLSFDNLGELVFDVLNIDHAQCVGFNYSTGRYDTREIKFRPGVDISPYIKEPFEFMGHEVYTQKQMNNMMKVTFKNVPFNVPDEEIIQLCKAYGNPLYNKVNYERMFNSRNKGMMGATRWVEMDMKQGVVMKNFYWLEGPLPGDKGTRITVLHNGQDQQCSHCLKTGSEGCPAKGNGRACDELKTPRTKMSDYMMELKKKTGYESLKSQYLKQYPSLNSDPIGNMDDTSKEEEDPDSLFPTNPVEARDAKICELENKVAKMSESLDAYAKIKANFQNTVKTTVTARNKLKHIKKVTEDRLKECLQKPNFEEHSKVLVSLLYAVIDEESFDIDPASETLRLKSNFLKDTEESIEAINDDLGSIVQKERLENIKSQITEKVNEAAVKNKERKLSVGSKDGRKRCLSTDVSGERSSSRSRSGSSISSST